MADIYATITEASEQIQRQIADILELRAAEAGSWFGHIAYASLIARKPHR